MDWWSLIFFLIIGASLIYLGLGVSCVIRAHWSAGPDLAWLKLNFSTLVNLISLCWLMAGILVIADYYGLITMWGYGYAISR
jgi:hypothetical protein